MVKYWPFKVRGSGSTTLGGSVYILLCVPDGSPYFQVDLRLTESSQLSIPIGHSANSLSKDYAKMH